MAGSMAACFCTGACRAPGGRCPASPANTLDVDLAERLRALGYECFSNEQRKQNVANIVALSDLPSGG